jgi:hypothetical protein
MARNDVKALFLLHAEEQTAARDPATHGFSPARFETRDPGALAAGIGVRATSMKASFAQTVRRGAG